MERSTVDMPVAPGQALEVVVTEIDVSFNDLIGFAFKATISFLIAFLCLGIVVAFPAFLIYQAVR